MGSGEAEDRFRKRLRDEREQRKWSQADLARRLSETGPRVHPTTIAKIESGDRSVRIGEAAAIADIFRMSLDRVLGRTVDDDAEFSYRFKSLQDKAREALISVESLHAQFRDRLYALLEFPFVENRDRIRHYGLNVTTNMNAVLDSLIPLADMPAPDRSAEEKWQRGDDGTHLGGSEDGADA